MTHNRVIEKEWNMQALIIANGAQPSKDRLCILAAQAGFIAVSYTHLTLPTSDLV